MKLRHKVALAVMAYLGLLLLAHTVGAEPLQMFSAHEPHSLGNPGIIALLIVGAIFFLV